MTSVRSVPGWAARCSAWWPGRTGRGRPRADPPDAGHAVVRRGPADPAGARRCVDVRRWAARAASAVAAPAGDGRRRRALRLPRRPVGPAAPHQHLPGGDHVRPGGRRAARGRQGARHPPRVRGDGARRPPVRGVRPAPAGVGAHRRGGQLPARAPALRRAAAGPGRPGRVRRRHRPVGVRWASSIRRDRGRAGRAARVIPAGTGRNGRCA